MWSMGGYLVPVGTVLVTPDLSFIRARTVKCGDTGLHSHRLRIVLKL